MPKIVVPDSSVIKFDDVLPVEIINHDYNFETKKVSFKYRVRFQVTSVDVLKTPVFLNFSEQSPYKSRINMFKNRAISTTSLALNAINTFDKLRISSLKEDRPFISSVAIEYADIVRGYVDFDVDLGNVGTMTMFAYFASNDRKSTQILSLLSFENSEIIERYEMPYDDFIFNTQPVGKNLRRILVGTNDRKIGSFKVTTRKLYGVTQGQLDTQEKTFSIRLTGNQGFVDIPESDSECREYRVSPVSFLTRTALSQCKSVRVNETHFQTGKCIVYSSEVGSQYAKIAIQSIPEGVVSASLLRKNLTQKEIKYDTILVTGNISDLSEGVTDTTIIPYNAYDYKFRLEFTNGNKIITESSCVVFPMILNDVASLKVTLTSSTTTNNIATSNFNAEVIYKNTSQVSRVITDLKSLGINDIFPNEIKNLSTQIDPLISVLVTKVSIRSGIEEKVGLFKPGPITIQTSDVTDTLYQFEVCVRSPADVIEEIGSSSDFTGKISAETNRNNIIDNILSKNNVVNPKNFTQKFFSKKSLLKGQLAYGEALQTSSTGLEAGRTGIRRSVLVRNDKIAPSIAVQLIKRRPDGLYVKWTADNLEDVTKFEIQASDGVIQTCDVNKDVRNYAAAIKTTSAQATLSAYTNYGTIITSGLKE